MCSIVVIMNLLVLVAANVDYFKYDYDSRMVTIESGRVRGYIDNEYDIFAFYGIPYATAPKGHKRFLAPLPAPKWTYILDARDRHIMCPQFDVYKPPESTVDSRRADCLIANIYVPNTIEKDIPVLVDIHGGSYQVGYGNMLTLKKLVDTKRVIVVNFNYRLGAYGFLCLRTERIPGNAGMKDMIALLRWVKKNIAAFGGNPNDVTISEYSEGASAVDLLLLSPLAKGLFNKAIPESGPNLATFAIQKNPVAIAQKLAIALNYTNVHSVMDLEVFYMLTPLEWMNKDDFVKNIDSTSQFAPCIEQDFGQEAFLLESPFDILSKGNYVKVPVLCGFTETVGIANVEFYKQWISKMNENFSELLPVDLEFNDELELLAVAASVREFYFGNDTKPIKFDNITMQATVNYFSDVFFEYATLRSVRLQVQAGNKQMYLYKFSYFDVEEENEHHANGLGGLLYEYSNSMFQKSETSTKKLNRLGDILRELWLNFITTGMPVPLGSSFPAWPPANAEGSPYMSIGDLLKLENSHRESWHRINFWHGIYDRYYTRSNPLPPPQSIKSDLNIAYMH